MTESGEKFDRTKRMSNVVKRLLEDSEPVYGMEANSEERAKSKEAHMGCKENILTDAAGKESLEGLLSEKPIFYDLNEEAPREIFLESKFSRFANDPVWQKLIEDPTEYIEEKLKPINRGEVSDGELPSGETIANMLERQAGYDTSKVKFMEIAGVKMVVKRADKQKIAKDDLEEYNLAKKAFIAGIPTPGPIGYIKDKGNTYLLFELMPDTEDMNEFYYGNYYKQVSASHTILLYCPYDIEDLFICRDELGENDKAEVEKLRLMSEVRYWLLYVLDRIFRFHLEYKHKHIDGVEEIKEYLRPHVTIWAKHEDEVAVFQTINDLIGVDLAKVNLDSLSADVVADWLRKLEQNRDKVERYKEEYKELGRELAERIIPEHQRKLYGAELAKSLHQFRQDVEKKCQQAGIKHKDFDLRNILIKLDKDGRALPDDNGNAQFMIIDWEQK